MDYLKLIKTLSKDNKYTKTYVGLVSKRLANPYEGDHKEKHHIVPSSFGKNNDYKLDKDNLVSLSLREHYICHKLLIKMVKNANYLKKVKFAFLMMSCKYKECSVSYATKKAMRSEAMTEQWKDEEFRANHYALSEENRNRALKEMQDPIRKAKFVKAGQDGGKKVRDADPKQWVQNSMGSKEGRAKAKDTHKTDEYREFCRQRELSKPKEDRIKLAHIGQQALVAKCGGEEKYKKMLSERIKGRKKYINPTTGQVKVTREPIDGWVLVIEHNKQQKVR